jgi:DNA polymerase/3'-5' exonuclease PolX
MPGHYAEVAKMFDQTAELLEIKGDNPFRSRAYRRAARVLEGLPKSAAAMLSAGEDLAELPGISHDLAGKIAAIIETGKFDLLQSLKRELPGDLGEIVAIPGLRPKRVKVLVDELGVRSIEDIRRAVKSGRLGELRGFGPKLQQNIAAAIAKPIAVKRFKLPFVEAEATGLIDWLRPSLEGGRIVVVGSFRRRRDTVGDLDVRKRARTQPPPATSWRDMKMSPEWSLTVRPERPLFCAQAFRSTCALSRRKATALRCSNLPAPRRITSPCEISPSIAVGSSTNTAYSAKQVDRRRN